MMFSPVSRAIRRPVVLTSRHYSNLMTKRHVSVSVWQTSHRKYEQSSRPEDCNFINAFANQLIISRSCSEFNIARPTSDVVLKPTAQEKTDQEELPPHFYQLSRLVLEGKISVAKLSEDTDFRDCCYRVRRSVQKLNFKSISSILESLLVMGYPNDSDVTIALETEILWRTHKLPLEDMLTVLEYHYKYQDTELQKKVLSTLSDQVQTKVADLTKFEDLMIVLGLHMHGVFPEKFLPQLEDHLMELFRFKEYPQSPQKLCKLLVRLQLKGRRKLPLLKEISIALQTMDVSIVPTLYIINAIFSMKSLNYYDDQLLKMFCDTLASRKPSFIAQIDKPNLVTGLLTAVGKFRFQHEPLLDVVFNEVALDSNMLRFQERSSLLLTLAKLNYRPKNLDNVVKEQIIAQESRQSLNEDAWLDYVWSLAYFNLITQRHLDDLLPTEVAEKLKNSAPDEFVIQKAKLMNIYGIASHEMKLTVPGLPFDINTTVFPGKSNEYNVVKNLVLEHLKTFLPEDEFVKANVRYDFGAEIDAEFIINPNMKALPVATKDLPEGYQRCALLITFFKDSLLGKPDKYVGQMALTMRLLRNAGRSVVLVDQNYLKQRSTVAKVQQLQKVIMQQLRAPVDDIEN